MILSIYNEKKKKPWNLNLVPTMQLGWYTAHMRWSELALPSLTALRFSLFLPAPSYDSRVVCCGVGGWTFNAGIPSVYTERMWSANRLV